MEKRSILEIVGIGYRQGFLDGLNIERMKNGEEEITENEFEAKGGNSEIIDQAIEKVIMDNNLEE